MRRILLVILFWGCYLVQCRAQDVIDASVPGVPFTHFWSTCVGAGRANEGLRASWLEQLSTVRNDCGFQYVRFHGLFSDDMFVYREMPVRGSAKTIPVYDFQYIDDLFDRMLKIGVRPFVELGFFPKDIAAENSKTQMWWKGNVTPPQTFEKWDTLIVKFVQHCEQRWGKAEVREWYFEVWNEPNLKGFFDSDQAHYLQMYKETAEAVKGVDPQLRIGGPATSSFRTVKDAAGNTKYIGAWVEDFLAYCAANKLPVDFVSTHPYPHEWAFDAEMEKLDIAKLRPMTSTHDDMLWLKNTISASAYPHAEIHCTEWSSSASSRDHSHDRLPAAAFILKVNLQSIGLVNSLSYWTFTDVFEEKGAGNSIFHGGFGMINYQGIVKPTYHAYRMLNRLGDHYVYRGDDRFVSKDSKTGKVTAILYHYPDEMKGMGVPVSNGDNVSSAENATKLGSPKAFTLTLKGLKPGTMFSIETMDKMHGDAFESWRKMSSPEPPDPAQTEQLKQAAMATLKEQIRVNGKGELIFKRTLEPWACVLIAQQ